MGGLRIFSSGVQGVEGRGVCLMFSPSQSWWGGGEGDLGLGTGAVMTSGAGAHTEGTGHGEAVSGGVPLSTLLRPVFPPGSYFSEATRFEVLSDVAAMTDSWGRYHLPVPPRTQASLAPVLPWLFPHGGPGFPDPLTPACVWVDLLSCPRHSVIFSQDGSEALPGVTL
jgi:hypothetical protein